jgi:hypothetical protein
MCKISTVIILLTGFLTAGLYLNASAARAQDASQYNHEDQVINDEGYGKDDTEYYNSEDDVNDEGLSIEQNQT